MKLKINLTEKLNFSVPVPALALNQGIPAGPESENLGKAENPMRYIFLSLAIIDVLEAVS